MLLFLALSFVLGSVGRNCTIGKFQGTCINTDAESCSFGKIDVNQCGLHGACCVQEFGSCRDQRGTCMDVSLCVGETITNSPCGAQDFDGDMVCCVPSEAKRQTKRMNQQATINQNGIDLVKSFEGWAPCWYRDAAGYPTIGYGHLIKSGEPYSSGTCITTEQGEDLLKSDIHSAETCVNRAVTIPLNGNQFSALVSFTFNLGCGSFSSSTLLRRVNAGDFAQVCPELLRWNHAGGQVLAGLTRRRQAECDLFGNTQTTQVSQSSGSPPPPRSPPPRSSCSCNC